MRCLFCSVIFCLITACATSAKKLNSDTKSSSPTRKSFFTAILAHYYPDYHPYRGGDRYLIGSHSEVTSVEPWPELWEATIWDLKPNADKLYSLDFAKWRRSPDSYSYQGAVVVDNMQCVEMSGVRAFCTCRHGDTGALTFRYQYADDSNNQGWLSTGLFYHRKEASGHWGMVRLLGETSPSPSFHVNNPVNVIGNGNHNESQLIEETTQACGETAFVQTLPSSEEIISHPLEIFPFSMIFSRTEQTPPASLIPES